MSLDFLRYKKLPNGRWQVYDRDGHTAEGFTKEEAKRLYHLYYKVSGVNEYVRHGIIPSEKLTLDK